MEGGADAMVDDKTKEEDGAVAAADGKKKATEEKDAGAEEGGGGGEGLDAMETDAVAAGGDDGTAAEGSGAEGGEGGGGGDGNNNDNNDNNVQGHRDAVIGIDFAPSAGGGGVLASSGLEKDKTIKLWVTL
jgi:hypothetical protein